MLSGAWKANCPSCGAPIEFRLGASAGLVCPYCRFSVVRADGQLTTLGKVADLAPTTPLFSLGDRGHVEGKEFLVLGRQQLDHGSGPWDEWYVAFEDERTAWIARAQGRWFVTEPRVVPNVPRVATLSIGDAVELNELPPLRVVELGHYRVVSAEGELPVAIRSGDEARYADLSGRARRFGTIDDDGTTPPSLFFGRELDAKDVGVVRTTNGPRHEHAIPVQRLSCPKCGAPLPLRVPDALRIACPACGVLLDCDNGALRVFDVASRRRSKPPIPLGSTGALEGESFTVVGYLRRSTTVDGVEYPWEEFLLAGEHRYAWLTLDRGHCTLVREIPAGGIDDAGGSATYRDTSFRLFSRVEGVVLDVAGEFTWKVKVGDRASLRDFIAPPEILSSERTDKEITWSYGTYVRSADVWMAFGLKTPPPTVDGVGACQPNPVPPLGNRAWSLLAALFVVAFGASLAFPSRALYSSSVVVADRPADSRTADEPDPVTVFQDFRIVRGPTVLSLELEATLYVDGNLSADVQLIDTRSGVVREAELVAEHYSGYDGGESWVEGDTRPTIRLARVPAGIYLLRIETDWDTWPLTFRSNPVPPMMAPRGTLTIRENDPSYGNLWCAAILLVIPFLLAWFRANQFESERNWESNVGDSE